MIGVDTNVLLRYVTEDDAAQAQAAARLFKRQTGRGEPIRVGLVVLAELSWVLRSRYGASRAEIADAIDDLLIDPIVDFQDEAAVAVAANLFGESTAELADLLIAAVNTLHGCSATLTFDRAAAKLAGMALLA